MSVNTAYYVLPFLFATIAFGQYATAPIATATSSSLSITWTFPNYNLRHLYKYETTIQILFPSEIYLEPNSWHTVYYKQDGPDTAGYILPGLNPSTMYQLRYQVRQVPSIT